MTQQPAAKEIAQGLVLVTHAENLLRQALQHPMREGGGEGEEDELAIWKAFLGELRALAGAPGSATGNSEGRNERKRCGDVEAERRSEKSAAARFLLAELESLEVLEVRVVLGDEGDFALRGGGGVYLC